MTVHDLLSQITQIDGFLGTGSATDKILGPIVDMGLFESVLHIALCSSGATSTANWLGHREGTATDAMSDTTGKVDNTLDCLYLDVRRPKKRYVQGFFNASGSSHKGVGIVSIRYGARSVPTTNNASSTGTQLYSPGTGTASG